MRFILVGCLVGWLVSGVEGIASAQQSQPFSYDAKGKCDPFVPLVRDGRITPCRFTPEGTLVFHGVVWDSAGDSVALINDAEVRVGDPVEDYRVAEIRPDAVVLMRDQEVRMLRISFEGAVDGTTHDLPDYHRPDRTR